LTTTFAGVLGRCRGFGRGLSTNGDDGTTGMTGASSPGIPVETTGGAWKKAGSVEGIVVVVVTVGMGAAVEAGGSWSDVGLLYDEVSEGSSPGRSCSGDPKDSISSALELGLDCA